MSNVRPSHLALARRLSEANHDAGVHPEHGVVIYYSGRVWRVAGGDFVRPSMFCLAGVRVADVHWLTRRVRKDPVT